MVTIRDGHPDDAAEIARMISDFNVEENSPGRIDTDGVMDLCFGDRPLFKPVVAEEGGKLVGYTLLMGYFDTDPCAWCTHMQDLYVAPDSRSQRIGRRLIAAAARHTIEQGRHELFWHVRERNDRGRAFYAEVGGREQKLMPVTLADDALKRLADEGV